MARDPVLFVQANAEWYGSDRAFLALAVALRDAGWPLRAVLPAEGRVARKLREAGVDVVIAHPGVPRPRAWSRWRLARWVALSLPRATLTMYKLARSSALVHLNTSTILGGLAGAVLARRPVLLHLREYQPASSLGWRFYARLTRRYLRAVIAVSEDVAAQARAAGFGDLVVVVHDGLRFPPPPVQHGRGVISVGRINEWKGHEVLVDAVALLRDRGVKVPVRIAGDAFPGSEHLEEALRQRIEDRGVADGVELLGFVDDVDRLHAEASIFVSAATRPEPFGLALLGAMAAGCAPIASDAGGPREIVVSGTTGLLVPPGDPEALARAIETLWLDPDRARAMGQAAAADVRERFSVERAATRVAEQYTRVLER